MKKIYYLSTCDTCRKIMQQANISKAAGFELQDIKTSSLTTPQLDALKELAGSYESLFSRKSMQYKTLGLKDVPLTEKDYRNYILQHYTFLKRPVVVIGKEIFIGSDKGNVARLVAAAQKA